MHAALLAQFRCLRDVTVDFWASALPFRAGLACAPCVHHDLIPLKFQCCIVGAFVSCFVHALKTVMSCLFSCHNYFWRRMVFCQLDVLCVSLFISCCVYAPATPRSKNIPKQRKCLTAVLSTSSLHVVQSKLCAAPPKDDASENHMLSHCINLFFHPDWLGLNFGRRILYRHPCNN